MGNRLYETKKMNKPYGRKGKKLPVSSVYFRFSLENLKPVIRYLIRKL